MNGQYVVNEIKRDLDAILSGDSEKLVSDAEKMGKLLGQRGMTTSQIRKIFTDVKRIKMREFDRYELDILRPKMAYVAGRHKRGARDLQEVLDAAIQKVDSKEKFDKFRDFFEAIVAYHYKYEK